MTASVANLESGVLFRRYAPQETALRDRYLEIDAASQVAEARARAEETLRRSALLLEIFAVSVCFREVQDDLEAASPQDPPRPFAYFRERVKASCGLDLSSVLDEAAEELESFPEPPEGWSRPSVPALVRATRSLLEACPVDALERLGAELGLENWAFRCRNAFNALRGFVLRNDEREQSRLRLVGTKYARGDLSIDEAALLLDLEPADAVWELEGCGHSRALDVVRLNDGERASLLAAVRADRLARQGEPVYSRERVVRDVVSSERIEGVDARSWLPRTRP